MAVDDPIFAAIDRHRRAEAAHLAAIEHERDGDWTIMEKSCHDENEAFGTLVGAAATTVDGLFAKIEYLREIATREAWMPR